MPASFKTVESYIVPVTLFVLIFAGVSAFPQAASEWVLLNESSAAASGKAGTVLGNGYNRLGSKIAAHASKVQQTEPVIHTKKRIGPSLHHFRGPTITNTPSMIISIQGGRAVRSSSTAGLPPATQRSSPN